jgi:mannan endo-1,4-beta-mannosidase
VPSDRSATRPALLLLVGLLASAIALAGCGLPLISTDGASPATEGFVRQDGTQLAVGGQPYRFEGLNIFQAASHGTCGGTLDLKEALHKIDHGQTVFRAWFFQAFVVRHGQFDWVPFDKLLADAAARHERVIVTLGNEYNYCDGPQKDLVWWQTGYRTKVYPGDLVTYRQWVADIVARYKDNPTIAIWQLVNEGSAVSPGNSCSESAALAAMKAFAKNVGGLVKSIDSNHLVSLGDIPGGCGSYGVDYETLNAVRYLNVCDYHDYSYPGVPMGSPGINGLAMSIQYCHADRKPIMVAETGILVTSPSMLRTRAKEFAAKFAAQFQAGVVGELMWSWVKAPTYVVPPTAADFGIAPRDPALRVLASPSD